MTEEEAEDEKKKAKQDLDGKVKNTDVIDLAMQEMVAKMDRENEEKHREDDLSLVKEFIDWLLARKVKEKPLWRSSRREELERYIWKWRRLVPIPFASEGFYFRRGSNRKVKYWGMMDPKKEKEGLGMCLWPDPPHGGGGEIHAPAHSLPRPCTYSGGVGVASGLIGRSAQITHEANHSSPSAIHSIRAPNSGWCLHLPWDPLRRNFLAPGRCLVFVFCVLPRI